MDQSGFAPSPNLREAPTEEVRLTHRRLLAPHVVNIILISVPMDCHPCQATPHESNILKKGQDLLTDLNWCDVSGGYVLSMNALLSSKDYVFSTCYLQQIPIFQRFNAIRFFGEVGNFWNLHRVHCAHRWNILWVYPCQLFDGSNYLLFKFWLSQETPNRHMQMWPLKNLT